MQHFPDTLTLAITLDASKTFAIVTINETSVGRVRLIEKPMRDAITDKILVSHHMQFRGHSAVFHNPIPSYRSECYYGDRHIPLTEAIALPKVRAEILSHAIRIYLRIVADRLEAEAIAA
jgi:hypothetical protein